jgi:uncharacterized membrane protein
MSILTQLASALEPWQTYWHDHDAVSTGITAAHVAAIVVAGGLAIAADRMSLRVLKRSSAERSAHASELRDVHRPVLMALALIVITGLLMAAADIEEFFEKPIFWIKMGLIVVLLINGAMMQKSEGRVLAGTASPPATSNEAEWARIGRFARVSMTLWVVITIVGVVLAS